MDKLEISNVSINDVLEIVEFHFGKGCALTCAERNRQIVVEGWTPEHDAKHTDNSMAKAAACYAMPIDEREKYQSYTFKEPKRWFPRWWPKSWSVDWWKPTPENRVKELLKAGGLIAAEIDRLLALSNSD